MTVSSHDLMIFAYDLVKFMSEKKSPSQTHEDAQFNSQDRYVCVCVCERERERERERENIVFVRFLLRNDSLCSFCAMKKLTSIMGF